MKTLDNLRYAVLLLFTFFFAGHIATATPRHKAGATHKFTIHTAATHTFWKAEWTKTLRTAHNIYEEMGLQDSGLSKQAFEYAWIGYSKLQRRGALHKTGILSICDFSQSSSNQRLFVIDVRNRRLIYHTFVAHGINSGKEYASSFSNRQDSWKSSMGFY